MTHSTIVACLALLVVSAGAGAQDPARGARLYENHCTGCHTSVAHERSHRKADSWESLVGWVQRWQEHLVLGWSAEDRADVAAHLDDRFYHFGKRATQ